MYENFILSKLFIYLKIVCILINCVELAADEPLLDPNSPFKIFLDDADLFFTILFTTEMSLKVISMGFFYNTVNNNEAYIRNSWNVLDFTIVIVNLIQLINIIGQFN